MKITQKIDKYMIDKPNYKNYFYENLFKKV